MQSQYFFPSQISKNKYAVEHQIYEAIYEDSPTIPVNTKPTDNSTKEENSNTSRSIKIVIAGDPGIGSRSLHLRFIEKAFIQNPRKWNFRIRILNFECIFISFTLSYSIQTI